MNVQTNNISDAVKHIETLQPAQRKEVFQFIDFLMTRYENSVQVEQTDKPKKKRQAGTAKGKAVFADDFKMTQEEFLGLNKNVSE